MAEKIARFEKVSYKQFKEDFLKTLGTNYLLEMNYISYFDDSSTENEKVDLIIKEIYDNIKLPKRGTTQSAGYDFFSPITISLKKNEIITIPTGIRAEINPDWVLTCYPRSGHGFKNGLFLFNTVGIIDADYYNSDNEGHIMLKIANRNVKDFYIEAGKGIMQGIFLPYGITVDDDATGERNGGFGSTDK